LIKYTLKLVDTLVSFICVLTLFGLFEESEGIDGITAGSSKFLEHFSLDVIYPKYKPFLLK